MPVFYENPRSHMKSDIAKKFWVLQNFVPSHLVYDRNLMLQMNIADTYCSLAVLIFLICLGWESNPGFFNLFMFKFSHFTTELQWQ